MIDQRQTSVSLVALGEVLDMSPSGYYASRQRTVSVHRGVDGHNVCRQTNVPAIQ